MSVERIYVTREQYADHSKSKETTRVPRPTSRNITYFVFLYKSIKSQRKVHSCPWPLLISQNVFIVLDKESQELEIGDGPKRYEWQIGSIKYKALAELNKPNQR